MNLTAACAFGLEALVKRELIALGYQPKVSQPGRIDFQGDWSAVCRANIWLRTADRVLIQIQQFDSPDFDALFDTIKDFDWSQYIPADAAFPVVGKSRLSELTSVPAIQRTVKKALVESLQKHHNVTELPETGATYKVEIAMLKDVATLTLDTTGPSLHKRGYRRLVAEAPIKETLAAALVDLSVWRPDRALVDPFCGSGTIAIEAALAGCNIAPGISRDFSSSNWGTIDKEFWNKAIEEANDQRRNDVEMQIIATDRDKEVLDKARYHADQAGVAEHIHFEQKPFAELRSSRKHGCIVTNPPYGERLDQQQRLIGLYQSIPAVMQRLPTWSLFLITNMPKFEGLIQKQATRRRKLFNGRLECTYYQFLGPRPPRPHRAGDQTSEVVDAKSSPEPNWIPVENAQPYSSEIAAEGDTPSKTSTTESVAVTANNEPQTEALFGGLTAKDHEQAGLFKNRLTKLARHLRRWPTKRNITCFRLYERDIPEIPLVVDRYEDYLHITEYERPHDRDIARHAQWLDLMCETAAATLDVPTANVYLKRRKKDSDNRQYEKVSRAGKIATVNEGGLKFLINLTDYVDTGLFLDHRKTRKMVFDEAEDKDFLNLFAYTGSFSVYAAKAHASSTTTVDLSKNYLEWAQRNMEANGLSDSKHNFVASDILEFLTAAADNPMRMYDLAVVDPPTFSNSKKTSQDWEIQSRHVELLNLVHQIMRTGGVVYFSTNFRRFKFDSAALPNFECREISKQTVPEDFRNKRIHRCWRLVVL